MVRMSYEKSPVTSDSLIFIYRLSQNPMRYKPFRILLIYSFSVLLLGETTLFVYFAALADLQSLVVRSVELSYVLYILLQMVIVFNVCGILEKQRTSMFSDLFRSSEGVSERTKRKISRDVAFFSKATACCTSMTVICGVTFCLRGDVDEILFVPWFLKRHCGRLAPFLTLVYLSAFPAVAYASSAVSYLWAYYTRHCVFQQYILQDYLRDISTGFSGSEERNVYYDDEYQRVVGLKLRFCIKYAVDIKRLLIDNAKLTYVYVILCYVVGALTAASSVFTVLHSSIDRDLYPCIVSCSVMMALILFLFTNAGQSTLDETDRTFETARRCKWYTWNDKNKKLFLSLLAYVMKPHKFLGSGIAGVDYALITRMMKLLFSLVTILNDVSAKAKN